MRTRKRSGALARRVDCSVLQGINMKACELNVSELVLGDMNDNRAALSAVKAPVLHVECID